MAEISNSLGDGCFRVWPHCDGCAHDYAVLALEVCSYVTQLPATIFYNSSGIVYRRVDFHGYQ